MDTRCWLAPGQLVGIVVDLVRQTDETQDLVHLTARRPLLTAGDLQRVEHVVGDGLVLQQLEVLEHAADVSPQIRHFPPPQGAQVAPAHEDASPVRSSSLMSNRMNVDFPEPEAPTKKTNSPFSIWMLIASRPMVSGG